MNRSYYIRSLFEYEGESKARHKIAGAALGLGGLGVAALAGHAAAKGQSFGQSFHNVHQHASNMFAGMKVHPSFSSVASHYTYEGPGLEQVQTYNGHPVRPEDAPALVKHAKTLRKAMGNG